MNVKPPFGSDPIVFLAGCLTVNIRFQLRVSSGKEKSRPLLSRLTGVPFRLCFSSPNWRQIVVGCLLEIGQFPLLRLAVMTRVFLLLTPRSLTVRVPVFLVSLTNTFLFLFGPSSQSWGRVAWPFIVGVKKQRDWYRHKIGPY